MDLPGCMPGMDDTLSFAHWISHYWVGMIAIAINETRPDHAAACRKPPVLLRPVRGSEGQLQLGFDLAKAILPARYFREIGCRSDLANFGSVSRSVPLALLVQTERAIRNQMPTATPHDEWCKSPSAPFEPSFSVHKRERVRHEKNSSVKLRSELLCVLRAGQIQRYMFVDPCT